MYDTMKKENMKKEVSAIKTDIVIEKMVKYAWLTWHLKRLCTWCLLPPLCSRYIKMNFWSRFYEPLGFWKKLKACFGISSVHKRQWQKWSSKGIFTKLDVLDVCTLTARQPLLQTALFFASDNLKYQDWCRNVFKILFGFWNLELQGRFSRPGPLLI